MRSLLIGCGALVLAICLSGCDLGPSEPSAYDPNEKSFSQQLDDQRAYQNATEYFKAQGDPHYNPKYVNEATGMRTSIPPY